MEKGKMIAKLKFWFGSEFEDLFNEKYIVEYVDLFVYIYEAEK